MGEDFNPEANDSDAKSGGDEEYDSDAADRSTDSEDRDMDASDNPKSPRKDKKKEDQGRGHAQAPHEFVLFLYWRDSQAGDSRQSGNEFDRDYQAARSKMEGTNSRRKAPLRGKSHPGQSPLSEGNGRVQGRRRRGANQVKSGQEANLETQREEKALANEKGNEKTIVASACARVKRNHFRFALIIGCGIG